MSGSSSLLRRILRAHRLLPKEMRRLGDAYVVKEFRDHRDVCVSLFVARRLLVRVLCHRPQEQLTRFRAGWEAYLADVESQ